IVRAPDGRILSIATTFINQAAVLTEGLDFMVDYDTELFDLGSLNLNLAGTYVYTFDIQQVPGGPVIDVAGATNDRITGASPNTKLRINARATWSNDGHMASIGVRYYDSLKFTLNPDVTIGSWAPIDVSY